LSITIIVFEPSLHKTWQFAYAIVALVLETRDLHGNTYISAHKTMVAVKEKIKIYIYCNSELLEQVENFLYIGLTDDGDCSKDITRT